MTSTDETILTFAEAFSRLGDRRHNDLYLEALATLVRMAKAEERQAAQQDRHDEDGTRSLPAEPRQAILMH